MLKALKFRIERALDLPSLTPEPGGGGFNSRQSQSERPAEPAAPSAPYVSYTPSAAAAPVRAVLRRVDSPCCTADATPGLHIRQVAPAPPRRTSVPRAASSEVAERDALIRELRDTNEVWTCCVAFRGACADATAAA